MSLFILSGIVREMSLVSDRVITKALGVLDTWVDYCLHDLY